MLIRRIPSIPTMSTFFGELNDARREMERVFDSLSGSAPSRTAGVYPPINVSEDADAVYVRAELPGVRPDDLEIKLEHDTLTLAGERQMADPGDGVSPHRREREWGSFRRSFSIPTPIDPDGVSARYTDGILTVALSKAAVARPKQITVEAGS